ncbi:hypothetical protein [Musicola paradisiaca]|uniref:Uncharacterized protein n=1 Tax=Musicola paradisiaca (strain Ech703) TaxID=579405 RepID=C6C4Z0_MUSP7|nr:hypothetical protein [Musicola paradisiaca]ACS85600.1 hypothetical protein Dd703_1804 [Musicola paradisiaca Ech703]
MKNDDQDVVNRLAGLDPQGALSALRRRRPEWVAGIADCRHSVLMPADGGGGFLPRFVAVAGGGLDRAGTGVARRGLQPRGHSGVDPCRGDFRLGQSVDAYAGACGENRVAAGFSH